MRSPPAKKPRQQVQLFDFRDIHVIMEIDLDLKIVFSRDVKFEFLF